MGVVGPLGVTIDDPTLETDLARGMKHVDELLVRMTTQDDLFGMTAISQHLIGAGGKRFRPFLALLSAQFGHSTDDAPARAAATVELCHLATLYHDDVMDDADMRRGVASVNSQWDNKAAILAGDFLYAQSGVLGTTLGVEAIRIQAEAATRLVRGQLAETLGPGDTDPIAHYHRVVADKTGALIAAACHLGATAASAPPYVSQTLREFGEQLGIAFQLGDDILDVSGDPAVEGKSRGVDLRQGVRTLPVLYVLASQAAEDAHLQELLMGDLTNDQLDEAVNLLDKHPAMNKARADLDVCLSKARSSLASLSDIPARKVLDALCDAALDRVGHSL